MQINLKILAVNIPLQTRSLVELLQDYRGGHKEFTNMVVVANELNELNDPLGNTPPKLFFSACDFQKTKFQIDLPPETVFKRCLLQGARFAGSVLENSRFDSCSFDGFALTDLYKHGIREFPGTFFRDQNATGVSWPGIQLPNAQLQHTKFNEADLTGANFQGAIITGTSFSGSILTNVNFEGCKIEGEGPNLMGATLGPQQIQALYTAGVRNFKGVICDGEHFDSFGFSGADFSGASFKGATLKGRLNGITIASTSFEGATLIGADFTGSRISVANSGDSPVLKNAKLGSAQLNTLYSLGVRNFSSVDCSGQNCTALDTPKADFSYANFDFATLTGNMSKAILVGARLNDLKISLDPIPGNSMYQFTGNRLNLSGVVIDSQTTFQKTDFSMIWVNGVELRKTDLESNSPFLGSTLTSTQWKEFVRLGLKDFRGVTIVGSDFAIDLKDVDMSHATVIPENPSNPVKIRGHWESVRCVGTNFTEVEIELYTPKDVVFDASVLCRSTLNLHSGNVTLYNLTHATSDGLVIDGRAAVLEVKTSALLGCDITGSFNVLRIIGDPNSTEKSMYKVKIDCRANQKEFSGLTYYKPR